MQYAQYHKWFYHRRGTIIPSNQWLLRRVTVGIIDGCTGRGVVRDYFRGLLAFVLLQNENSSTFQDLCKQLASFLLWFGLQVMCSFYHYISAKLYTNTFFQYHGIISWYFFNISYSTTFSLLVRHLIMLFVGPHFLFATVHLAFDPLVGTKLIITFKTPHSYSVIEYEKHMVSQV